MENIRVGIGRNTCALKNPFQLPLKLEKTSRKSKLNMRFCHRPAKNSGLHFHPSLFVYSWIHMPILGTTDWLLQSMSHFQEHSLD